MADSAAGTTPCRTPSRPAWTAATTPATGSASSTGTQSATRTPSTSPGVAVTRASVSGTGPSCGPSTTATPVPCTWAIQTSRSSATAELAGHPAAVGGDGGRVVAHVVAEVERVVRRTGPAAPPVGDDPAGSYRRRSGRGVLIEAVQRWATGSGRERQPLRNSGMSSSSSKSSFDSGRRPR